MPAYHLPACDRRLFLKTTVLGAAAFVFGQGANGAEGRPLRLALLSDTHIPADRLPGARGFNACEHLTSIVPDILATKPEGMVVAGDVSQLTGETPDYEVFLELIKPITEQLPVYLALGNHDHRENFHAAVKNLAGDVQPLEDKHVTVLEHEYLRLVMLDSLFYTRQKGGHLGKAQREWLNTWLAAHTDRPVALMFHHTLGEGDNDLLDTEYFFDMLAPHAQVKVLFHGHSHVWKIYERQGIKIINLPTTAHIWSPEQPIGWVDASFRKDGVDLTLKAFAGNRAEDGKVFNYTW